MSDSWPWPPGWRKLRQATFARYGRRCWRCGAFADTVDHVQPRILGGADDLSNLRPACRRCNCSTGARVGNALRPRKPLTARQRQAIALKNWQRAAR